MPRQTFAIVCDICNKPIMNFAPVWSGYALCGECEADFIARAMRDEGPEIERLDCPFCGRVMILVHPDVYECPHCGEMSERAD